uniref:F-actin monooxygenase n=1 Tax=Stomoxys calcitrans TaxID=35570 RepID=A0A1I8PQX2_STOCA
MDYSGSPDMGLDLCGPGPIYYNCTVKSMSRSAHQRQQQKLQMQQQQLLAQQMADNEAAAAAAEMFDLFCVATTMRQILGLHRQMCDVVGLRPAPLNEFYPKLKTKVRSWKAQALWKKFDARASHRAYAKGNACTGTRVLVIGAGPCGLRTAIEAQLLGAKVVVVEKRDRISRNNVLHLWPFVITDLRNLGAKKFYGKFCAGSIDHISIRQLQCILLKVALLLGVEIHEGVSFDRTIEPSGDGCGWRAQVSPADHAVSHYEFDVLIGADGKRNTLEGFKRKEFRGKLAIAITANFINKKTEAEAKAEEISGVAFIFNQSFFKELYHTTGIDLENIVYYKDETHYFVMTAKKHSLIDKGVIMQDFADPAELLAPINVNTEKLLDYAREAAEFSTKYQMPNLEFAVNHYGKPDVAMFDFTSMFAAESSCRVIVRHGFRLLQCLVGDSLLEPFWPTGSGCARGFLSSMDAAYAIKLWANPANSTLGVMAQRESIYRLLGQTTPENLQRDTGGYTVDPATRYPNLNRTSVNVWQVKHLIDTDDKNILEQTFMDTNALQVTQVDTPVRRKRRSGDTMPLSAVLLRWICAQLHAYDFAKELKEVSDVFTNGKVLCALINRYRPDLVDFNAIKDLGPIEMNDLAFKILDKELHIPRIMSGKDAAQLNTIESKIWLNYLEQICEVFRGEIPHVKHPKIDFSDLREKYRVNYTHAQPDFSKLLQLSSKQKAKSPIEDAVDVPQAAQKRSVLDEEKLKRQRRHEQMLGAGNAATGAGNAAQTDTPRRAKKRRSAEKAANIEERQKRLEEIEQNRQDRQSKRRQQRYQQTQNFYKSLHMLQANILLREADENTPFEDYSIFLYRQQAPEFNDRVKELERKLLFPDRERGDIPSSAPRSNADEQFSDRIKSMEQRISSRNNYGNDKKPKDLMRAIGKIDSNDWNVREIEKKIEQSKKTEVHGPKGREKVPKWNREQFQARQHKMAKPTRQDSAEEKFKEIDQTLKNLDKQLKEGNVLEVGERGRNKVASIAGQFVKRDDTPEEKTPPAPPASTKSSTKVALAFKKQAASEKCHFCRQTVYLMEKLQTENLVMHRGCLKCHHCHTNLRLGAYAFDRDDPNGRFYCTQHYRLPAKPTRPVVRKPGQRKSAPQTKEDAAAATLGITPAEQTAELVVNSGDESGGDDPRTPEKRGPVDNVSKMDLLERGQTPERIEFENTDAMSDGEPSEEHIIDEHEWSGRNFLPESNNDSESDLSSSDESDTESNSDMYEEANDSPLGVQTLQLASEWIGKQNYSDSDVSDDNYDSSEGLADDGKDDTEGEDFVKAREKRREEVRLPPLPPNLPTDTETEVQSDSESSTSDELEHNSATEISTDSEFDNDELIRSAPKIFIDDTHLRKPTKVQVKSTIIPPSMTQNYNGANTQHKAISGAGGGTYLAKYQTQQQPLMPQFKPLVQVDPSLLTSNRTPLQNPRPGDYLLNKTASTEGIASKKSLELKKRYLLGEPANGNKIQKSGSTSVLDSRIRSFQSNISECQKLLNPSNEISPSMKTFLDRTKLGEKTSQELMRSATNNILNDLKVEITIQKASSTASTDNEKENVFVNSKNELNKCMEYSETVNAVLLDAMSPNKKSPATTPTNNKSNIIETVDLVTPEKEIDRDKSDSNKVIDLTGDSPDQKSNRTILENETKTPDVSKDVKQVIPDILGHIEEHKDTSSSSKEEKSPQQEDNNMEKADAPEKQQDQHDDTEVQDVQIEVPNIAWKAHNSDNLSSSSSHSTCSSHSSSLEDIEHFILESTTSPETHNSAIAMVSTTSTGTGHQVPRVEVHDSSGTLMQIDSLMIIDGKYVGDPEDLKYMEVPEGIIVPAQPALKTTELGDEHEADHEHEPVTATPEPIETTVIEVKGQREVTTAIRQEDDEEPPPLPENGPPLPAKGPPRVNPSMLKFDTRNENKIESLKNLPLIQDTSAVEQTKAVKPISLNLSSAQKPAESSPITSPLIDMDKTPTGDLLSRGSDSETEPTGTAQILTETELSDWTADDCISENFVDMDFVKSSHGKGKSHKKGKRKGNAATGGVSAAGRLPSTNEVMKELAKTAPVAEFEGILKSIDLDDIEFMDTGSDSSGTEPHSATNTALLRNRGYVEFVDQTTPKHLPNAPIKSAQPIVFSSNETYKPIAMKRDEKLGIDYIEQGAYIMHEDANKTPVNESKQVIGSASAAMTSSSIMTQSLTDSSTINDLEEDSTNSQIQMSSISRPANYSVTTAGGATTTTEESEALTVVSSPLDSSPHTPRNSSNKQREYATAGSTPSSTDQAPKSSQSSSQSGNNSGTSSSKTTPPRQSSKESTSPSVPMPGDRRSNDELSYEEYVRALQQKIVQISTTARGDSLEARKQRRKSSKGEATSGGSGLIAPNQQQHQTTVIEPATETNIRYDTKDQGPSAPKSQNTGTTTMGSTSPVITDRTKAAGGGIAAQPQVQKVPEIPTLTSKLEEITKERTKQKDLIHDLVMDKLQSKKQLNAEKRLHRSRQRSILTSGLGGTGSGGAICGYSSGSSLSPTPKLAAAATTTDTNCTNQAHYHVSTAANSTSPSARTAAATQRFLSNSSSFKENTPLPSSYVSTYGMEALSPTRANAYKQRPFSEHLEGDQFKAFEERYKINKTPSFSNVKGSQRTTVSQTSSSEITTPIPPLRQNKGRNGVATADAESLTRDSNFSTSTENLRSEARARARLKSNSELGLSPEEKMQLLRKRIQADYNCNNSKQVDMRPDAASYERQTSLRESKMSTSKSVNDLAYLSNSQKQNVQQIGSGTISHQTPTVRADFTSDPNILMSATSQQQQGAKPLSKNSSRRAKDPERRKSLIQSLTNFFHMGQGGSSSSKENKHHKDHAASEGNSAQSEHPGTTGGGANTVSGSHGGSNSSAIDGVLSRFRISPKSKDKSKSCTELRSSYIGQKDDYSYHGSGYSSPARRLRTSSVSMAALSSYEAPKKLHSSQDALTHSQHLSHSTYYSQSQLNTRPNNNHNGSNYHQQRIQGSIGSNGSGSHHHHHQQQHYHSQHQQHPSSTKHQLYTNNRKDMRSTHNSPPTKKSSSSSAILAFSSSSPQLCVVHKSQSMTNTSSSNAVAAPAYDDQTPPPIPPLPLNYQRSDDESYTTETRDQKKQRAISKAVRQAELKRLRIAQEIQREQEEIEVQLKELETRGVLIEKALRGEEQTLENLESTNNVGSNDEKLLKELLEIWRNITQLKKRDEELGIRQQELQLEHRHAQLKEELNMRLSCNKLDKSSADVAAEGAILNEMLEIVAKRAALRPSSSTLDLATTSELLRGGSGGGATSGAEVASGSGSSKIHLSSSSHGQSNDNEESNI